MIEIGTRYGPLSYKVAFWPDDEELRRLADGIGAFDLTRVVQTEAGLEAHRSMMRRQIFHTQVIDLTPEPDAIFGDMRKTCRYEIRKVGREPDRVQVERNHPDARRDFLALYNDFVKRSRHIRPLSRRRLDEYASVSDVWVLYWDRRPMCGRLDARDASTGRARMIFSPSRRLDDEDDAKMTAQLSRFLLWSELQAYKAEGFRAYDLGGIGDGTSSIARFKLSFGGVPVNENSYLFGGALGRFAKAADGVRTKVLSKVHRRTA